MIDLLYFVANFNKDSPHHLAAIHQLASEMPGHLLSPEADWVTMYNEQPTEWRYEFKEHSS